MVIISYEFFFCLFISVNGPRAFILQLVNSKGDIRNCRVALLNGLILNKVIYCGDPLYEETKINNCGSIEILPSADCLFEVQAGTMNSPPQNGIFNLFSRFLNVLSKENFSDFYSLFLYYFFFVFAFPFQFKEKRRLSSPKKILEPSEKIARFDDQTSGYTDEKPQSVSSETKAGCANDDSSDDNSSDTSSTDSSSTDDSLSGLEDDLRLSESDELSIDAPEIIKSISSPPEKRILPIPRKLDYVPAPYVSDSDEENEPPNKNLAASKKFGGSVKKKRGSVLSSVLSENSNKNDEIEKRNMYIRIDQAQLDRYDINFLEDSEKNVHEIVKGMCHSLRFWLAVKFCNSLGSARGLKKANVMSKAKVCKLLGIKYKSFCVLKPKIKSKTFSDFDGLSPLEYQCLQRRTHADEIREYALNLESPEVRYVISVLDSD